MKLILMFILSINVALAANTNKANLTGFVNVGMYNNFYNSVHYSVYKNHDVTINSTGGIISIGFELIAYIKHKQKEGHKFTCTVKGVAASMMATILQVCDVRLSTKNSMFMQHRASPYGWIASQYDLIRFKLELSRMNLNLKHFIKKYVIPERRFGVKEALQIGYIDKVVL